MVTLRNPWLKKCARAASTIRCRLESGAWFRLKSLFLCFISGMVLILYYVNYISIFSFQNQEKCSNKISITCLTQQTFKRERVSQGSLLCQSELFSLADSV